MDISGNIISIVKETSDLKTIEKIYEMCCEKIKIEKEKMETAKQKMTNQTIKKIIDEDVLKMLNGDKCKEEIYDNIAFTSCVKIDHYWEKYFEIHFSHKTNGNPLYYDHQGKIRLSRDGVDNMKVDFDKGHFHLERCDCKICNVLAYIHDSIENKYKIFDDECWIF